MSELRLPEAFVRDLPDELSSMPIEERAIRTQSPDENFVILDDTHGYVRCRLPMPGFSYVCWIEVSREVYEITHDLWVEPTTRATIRCEGRLANALPPFEDDAGRLATAGVRDWQEPMPVIVALEACELANCVGTRDPKIQEALLAEVFRDVFAARVEEKLGDLWGRPAAYEEFETRDWHAAPRRLVIAEFPPGADLRWRYATVGLSSRPMPGGVRVEFAWEAPRRFEDESIFQAMASIASQPWRLKTDFFDGHVLPVPKGFPPGSDFKWALCYDASRAYPALHDFSILGRKVRVLMPLPLMEREKAALRNDETKYLNLEDYLR